MNVQNSMRMLYKTSFLSQSQAFFKSVSSYVLSHYTAIFFQAFNKWKISHQESIYYAETHTDDSQ
jgi:hypothetical protein